MQIKDLCIGANMEISTVIGSIKRQPQYHPVKLQNINDDGTMEIDIPFYGGQMVFCHVNALIEVVTVSSEGIFYFKATVISRTSKNDIPILVIKPETEMEKMQRREYFRVSCICTVKYRKYKLPVFGDNDEIYKVTRTSDISGGGMALVSNEKINNDDFLECVIMLEDNVEIQVIGKVISVKKHDINGKCWKIGVKYEKIGDKAREKIVNFVFKEQLKLRRRGMG